LPTNGSKIALHCVLGSRNAINADLPYTTGLPLSPNFVLMEVLA
jgi:hypothetical protein